MLGHRAVNLEDYLDILKRRWWLMAVPAVVLPIVAIAVTFFIPAQYVSQTLVLIDQQKVPDDFVKPIVTEDLDSRLASMREQILSRSSIQPIIDKYNLYGAQHLSMDDRIDLARKSIDIKPIHSEIANSNGLPGFFISFMASDAHTAQQVCAEITSLFTGANLRSRADAAEGTTAFLKEQLDGAKRTLDDQDAKLRDFEQRNFGKLPSDESNNVSLMGTLNTQLEAVTQSIQTMEQNKSVMEAMLAQQSQPTSAASVVQNPQVQQQELDDLLKQEADLSAHYQPDYPDVKAVHRKIADLRKEMAQTVSAPAPAAPGASVPNRGDSATVQQLRAQLRGLDLAIQSKHKQQDELEKQIGAYQARLQSTPQVEQEFKQLTRDLQTSQAFYDSLNNKMNQSQMATDLEHRQQGEQFRVMDESNLPDSPTYPKRSIFALGGLAAGVALGLLIVALLEYKDTALRTERDVWAFTQLPTLAVIAWSGEVGEMKLSKRDRLKRLFSRKTPKKVVVDAPA